MIVLAATWFVAGLARAGSSGLPETPAEARTFDYCGQAIEPAALDVALEPLEDPYDVDSRRAALDMKPYRLDLQQMSDGFCGR